MKNPNLNVVRSHARSLDQALELHEQWSDFENHFDASGLESAEVQDGIDNNLNDQLEIIEADIAAMHNEFHPEESLYQEALTAACAKLYELQKNETIAAVDAVTAAQHDVIKYSMLLFGFGK